MRWLHTFVNVLKSTDLYSMKVWILCYVDYILVRYMHEGKIFQTKAKICCIQSVGPWGRCFPSLNLFCQAVEIKSNVKTFFGDKIKNYIEEQLKWQVNLFSLTTKIFCKVSFIIHDFIFVVLEINMNWNKQDENN